MYVTKICTLYFSCLAVYVNRYAPGVIEIYLFEQKVKQLLMCKIIIYKNLQMIIDKARMEFYMNSTFYILFYYSRFYIQLIHGVLFCHRNFEISPGIYIKVG